MDENSKEQNLMLGEIIRSIRGVRDDQQALAIKVASLPTKEDLKENKDFFVEQMNEMKEHLQINVEQLSKVKSDTEKNTEWRLEFKKAFNYILGAIFVAVISMTTTVLMPKLLHSATPIEEVPHAIHLALPH